VEDISNIDELKGKIIEKLSAFAYLDNHKFNSLPLIYHVDVAAMYPNIILTNRLQPVAIVNEKICSSCVYNTPESNCKRDLEWMWKAEYFPINRGEYESIKLQFDKTYSQKHNDREYFPELKKKIKTYSRKMYKTTVTKIEELRKDTVCMRENPFYVNTVRSFRDRRYEFKEKVKIWSNKHKGYNSDGDVDQAKSAWNLMLLYDSLQLAHKIILNSFYGYVMRKGARWYSMEMAAMVTHTGANIISITRDLLLGVGKPLELDTDGVWTLLP
jgi:DNA polymerase epsilon subunit 1